MWSVGGISILDMDELRGPDLVRLDRAALQYEQEVSVHGVA